MSVAHPIVVSLRMPLRVVPLAFLLGACVSPQDLPLDQTFIPPLSQASAGLPGEDPAPVPARARMVPAAPLLDPEEPADRAAWRLRLTRL